MVMVIIMITVTQPGSTGFTILMVVSVIIHLVMLDSIMIHGITHGTGLHCISVMGGDILPMVITLITIIGTVIIMDTTMDIGTDIMPLTIMVQMDLIIMDQETQEAQTADMDVLDPMVIIHKPEHQHTRKEAGPY